MQRAKAETSSPSILRSAVLESVPGVVHGFSTRISPSGKAFDLGMPEAGDREAAERRRVEFARFVTGNGKRKWPLVTARQVHSDVIHVIKEIPTQPLAGDGLITNRRGVLLGIKTADCVPVLIADREGGAVGAFHAGWRGTLARIVEKGAGAMRQHFGAEPGHMVAAIGPCIHGGCYEVSPELRDRFASQFAYGNQLFSEVFSSDPVREKYPLLFMNMRAPGHGAPPSKPHLDLVEANRRQLISVGVPESAIDVSPLCTSCRTDLLFSHRAEKGNTGRMMAAIGMK
jgi:YfiH family protein